MSAPHERLQQAREERGYATGTAAAEAFGWPISTYLGHENGSRGLRADAARRYAAALGADPAWLLLGDDASPIAQRIGPLMRQKHFNPRSLAIAAGLGPDAVRDLFRGRVREPSATSLAAIAEALGCSVDYLLGADATAPPSEATIRRYAPPTSEKFGVSIATAPDGRVTLNLKANVSMGVAAQILALIEGDKPHD